MKSCVYGVLGLSSLSLLGCSTVMPLNLHSLPDPQYQFNYTAPVLVQAEGQGAEALKARYYLPKVADGLRQLGFQQVMVASAQQSVDNVQLIFRLSVSTEQQAYSYQATDYGYTHTEYFSHCYTDEQGVRACSQSARPVYGPVGTSERVGYTRYSEFKLTGIDSASQQTVLSVIASSSNTHCKDKKVEDFLVERALGYVDLSQRQELAFKVKMPEGYSCQ